MDDINPFWFFFLAWYIGLMLMLAAVQLWKRLAKRAVQKHGVLLAGDHDSHTIVTYMSDGQLTIRSEPMAPPPNITVNAAFCMELDRIEGRIAESREGSRKTEEGRPPLS